MVGVMPFWAVLDTSALFPMRFADALLCIAETSVYQPLWSEKILEELRQNVRQQYPDADIEWRIDQMKRYFPEALVERFEQLEPCLENDLKDRHVLAAAVVGRAQVIVTDNLKDFPKGSCSPYGIEAQSCDEFLTHCLHIDPVKVASAIYKVSTSKKKQPRSVDEVIDALAENAPGFARELREFLQEHVAQEPEFEAWLTAKSQEA